MATEPASNDRIVLNLAVPQMLVPEVARKYGQDVDTVK